MNKALRTFCVISLTTAAPSIVTAQSNTAFDGTYKGVSVTTTGEDAACKLFHSILQPLKINNSNGEFTGGTFATGEISFRGRVSPQGELDLWDVFGRNLLGKIDLSGKATGTLTIADYGCGFTMVWQKQ